MLLHAHSKTSCHFQLMLSFAGSDTTNTQPPQTETLASELPHIAAPLIPFLTFCPTQDPPGLTDTHLSPHQDLGGSQSPRQPQISTLGAQESQLDAESAAALALPPVLQPRHRMYQLSEKGILEMTGVSLLGMLTQLNLHGSALKRIEVSCSTLSSHDNESSNAVYVDSCLQIWTV
jgi:hypothetical protein